jgi:hypothetical protein
LARVSLIVGQRRLVEGVGQDWRAKFGGKGGPGGSSAGITAVAAVRGLAVALHKKPVSGGWRVQLLVRRGGVAESVSLTLNGGKKVPIDVHSESATIGGLSGELPGWSR